MQKGHKAWMSAEAVPLFGDLKGAMLTKIWRGELTTQSATVLHPVILILRQALLQ